MIITLINNVFFKVMQSYSIISTTHYPLPTTHYLLPYIIGPTINISTININPLHLCSILDTTHLTICTIYYHTLITTRYLLLPLYSILIYCAQTHARKQTRTHAHGDRDRLTSVIINIATRNCSRQAKAKKYCFL